MSVIDYLASSLGRRNQEPNKKLAHELCESRDEKAIAELVDNLDDGDKLIQSDCIAVLENIGYIDHKLISQYVDKFLQLLSSRNNRMIWGSMIVLSSIALDTADMIFTRLDIIMKTIEKGSVITVDNGIAVLSKVSSVKESYEKEIVPYLLKHLKTCRLKEVGQYSEKCMIAINSKNKEQFKEVLLKRLENLSSSRKARVMKVIRSIDS